jgi:hypothetical protein
VHSLNKNRTIDNDRVPLLKDNLEQKIDLKRFEISEKPIKKEEL